MHIYVDKMDRNQWAEEVDVSKENKQCSTVAEIMDSKARLHGFRVQVCHFRVCDSGAISLIPLWLLSFVTWYSDITHFTALWELKYYLILIYTSVYGVLGTV